MKAEEFKNMKLGWYNVEYLERYGFFLNKCKRVKKLIYLMGVDFFYNRAYFKQYVEYIIFEDIIKMEFYST